MKMEIVMDELKRLNELNGGQIISVFDSDFKTYGRVISEYDFSDWVKYMEMYTGIPESGNRYVASVSELEQMPLTKTISDFLYGGMPVQVGYCNGKNSTYNGFEYHKCSEINIAVTDFMLVLGHIWDVKELTYEVDQAQVVFVPKGTAIEMYQTTLHLSPCRTAKSGFKDIVVLAKGTNTLLEHKPECWKKQMRKSEDILLLQRNKWVISHPERKALIDQGAFPGVLGENRELKFE